MFEQLWKVYNTGVANNIPMEIILLVVGFGFNFFVIFYVFKYFSKRNKLVLENIDKLSDNFDKISRITQGSVDAISNQTYILQLLRNKNGEINSEQALKVYEKTITVAFYQIHESYNEVKEFINDKVPVNFDISSDEQFYETIRNLLKDKFRAIELEVISCLRLFTYNKNSLIDYLDSGWENEYSHIHNNIFVKLVERQNGLPSYLKSKQSVFVSDFEIYLKK